MWLYAVTNLNAGQPVINGLPLAGYVLAAGPISNYGLYLFSGTAAQLTAIGQLSNVYPLCAMTDDGLVRWRELDDTIASGVRTKLNNWLSAHGRPTIPAGWTYRQVLIKLVEYIKRQNDDWTLLGTWVKD